MIDTSAHSILANLWFCLLAFVLALYVITDGLDLGIGILSLMTPRVSERDQMIHSINHVWGANETWLVVLGGGLFGAFPIVYATLLSSMYGVVMLLIAALIMRGAAIEFRHAARNSRAWDYVFGVGSLLAAIAQGLILGRLITGFSGGTADFAFSLVSALGVVSGYILLGATYLIKKVAGRVERNARKWTILSVFTTMACALVLSFGTRSLSEVGLARWTEPNIFHVLLVFAFIAAMSGLYIVATTAMNRVLAPFAGAAALFLSSFIGLVTSLWPYVIPGQLKIHDAASDSSTLAFMLAGFGMLLPVMVGYNLYQYFIFRGKVEIEPY